MRAMRFTNVTANPRRPPSWVAGNASGRGVITLRPPKVPRALTGTPLDPDGEEGCDPAQSVTRLSTAPVSEGPESVPAPAPREQNEQRSDTYVDEVLPAPDDEAYAIIARAVTDVAKLRREILRSTEAQLAELAGLVARRVIAREVSINPRLVRGLVREGIEALGESDRMTVRIGPGFGDVRRDLERDLEGAASAQVVVDSSLESFGCIVETELGSVDESVDARLTALMDALAAGASGGREG